LKKNAGQQKAVLRGIKLATGEFIATTDDDYQHPIAELPDMLDELVKADIDLVIAALKTKQHDSVIRSIGTRMVGRFAAKAFKLKTPLKFSSFRVSRSAIAKAAAETNNPRPVVGYLLLSQTAQVNNYDIEHLARTHGASNYSLKQLAAYRIDMVVFYSDLPQRWAGYIGISLFGLSVLQAAYFIFRYFVVATSVSGYTSVIVLITLLFGSFFIISSMLFKYIFSLFQILPSGTEIGVGRFETSTAAQSMDAMEGAHII